MKIDPGNLDPDAIPHGMKTVQFRATRWGIIAQARPGKRSGKPSELQQQYINRFRFAGRMASNMTSLETLTAMEMAKGTQQVWRDVATQMTMGRYYILTQEDGTQLRGIERPVTNDPYAHRPPSLLLTHPKLPWDADYISIGDGNRLVL